MNTVFDTVKRAAGHLYKEIATHQNKIDHMQTQLRDMKREKDAMEETYSELCKYLNDNKETK